MTIEIKIQDELNKAAMEIDYMNHDAIPRAAKNAINRAVVTMRKESTQRIPKEMRLRPTNLKERYIRLRKAMGTSIAGLEGEVAYLTEPVPLLEFVRGSKDAIEQKGIRVKDRRKLRVEIRPGKRFMLKRAFIQRAHSKQVFKGSRRKGFKKQSAPSVGYVVLYRRMHLAIAQAGLDAFAKNFNSDLAFRLSKRQ